MGIFRQNQVFFMGIFRHINRVNILMYKFFLLFIFEQHFLYTPFI